jgi:hypothetical protein
MRRAKPVLPDNTGNLQAAWLGAFTSCQIITGDFGDFTVDPAVEWRFETGAGDWRSATR